MILNYYHVKTYFSVRLKIFLRSNWDLLFCSKRVDKAILGTKGESWIIVLNNHYNIVYSGGVGKDISFELELIERYNSNVFIFDPSPTGISTMKSFKNRLNINYQEIGLSGEDGSLFFFSPINKLEGSYTVSHSAGGNEVYSFNCEKLSNICKRNSHTIIDLLKIDIEGSEYGVIDDICSSDLIVRQICVEFHHFFKDVSRVKTLAAILKLYKKKYRLIHKSGSNYTFILEEYLK